MPIVKRTRPTLTVIEGSPPDLAGLAGELEAGEAARRRAAVRALANHPDPRGLDLIWERLERETAPSVRALMFTSFAEHRSVSVADRLARLLDSSDAMLRSAASEALQAMPAEAEPVLDRLLATDDADLRIFAVRILAQTAHAGAPRRLVEVLRRDDHINVCAAAVDGLVEIGTREALPVLADAATRFRGNPFMAFAVETAIHRIEGR
ncbi:PBS lyase [Aureimonas endophytica]|uniref:PBS lyase n=1 Tax=Aureimonas endophytica TaxID=2027858 RepID=A0A916ZT53_9HYPH|nr:HEAT repeat domain-containing protein [Aureimonas endophytica]GGE12939.1 PBS lyase [Aureimonas endophytica]